MIHIAIASIAAATMLAGCGHHVVYNQVVTTDARLMATQQPAHQSNQTLQMRTSKQAASPSHQQPMMVYNPSTRSHIPLSSLSAAPQPAKQGSQLMIVPISMLNAQGLVTSPHNRNIHIPMVQIPMLAMPAKPNPNPIKQLHQLLDQTMETPEENQD